MRYNVSCYPPGFRPEFGILFPGISGKLFLAANTSPPPPKRAFLATTSMRFIITLLLFPAIVRLCVAVCFVYVARSPESVRGPRDGMAHPVEKELSTVSQNGRNGIIIYLLCNWILFFFLHTFVLLSATRTEVSGRNSLTLTQEGKRWRTQVLRTAAFCLPDGLRRKPT